MKVYTGRRDAGRALCALKKSYVPLELVFREAQEVLSYLLDPLSALSPPPPSPFSPG